MRPSTRRSLLAAAVTAALVPALGAGPAQAAVPLDLKLEPCAVKWVLAPGTGSILDSTTSGGGDFDVENGTTGSGGATRGIEDGPGGFDTVAHDDLSYDPCP